MRTKRLLFFYKEISKITLNICTSHRGNSIWGSVRRSVSATVAGKPDWKVLYFSCSKEKVILDNKIRQGNRENILGPFSRLWWDVSSEINCKRKYPSLWPCHDMWSFTSCSKHGHIFFFIKAETFTTST